MLANKFIAGLDWTGGGCCGTGPAKGREGAGPPPSHSGTVPLPLPGKRKEKDRLFDCFPKGEAQGAKVVSFRRISSAHSPGCREKNKRGEENYYPREDDSFLLEFGDSVQVFGPAQSRPAPNCWVWLGLLGVRFRFPCSGPGFRSGNKTEFDAIKLRGSRLLGPDCLPMGHETNQYCQCNGGTTLQQCEDRQQTCMCFALIFFRSHGLVSDVHLLGVLACCLSRSSFVPHHRHHQVPLFF